MRHFDGSGAGRAIMFFLLGLLTYLLAARGIQHPPCQEGASVSTTPCAACPLKGDCAGLAEAR